MDRDGDSGGVVVGAGTCNVAVVRLGTRDVAVVRLVTCVADVDGAIGCGANDMGAVEVADAAASVVVAAGAGFVVTRIAGVPGVGCIRDFTITRKTRSPVTTTRAASPTNGRRFFIRRTICTRVWYTFHNPATAFVADFHIDCGLDSGRQCATPRQRTLHKQWCHDTIDIQLEEVLMKSPRVLAGLLSMALLGPTLVSGCAADRSTGGTSGAAAAIGGRGVDEQLYQYSSLSALMAGVYDGELTVGELLSQGDLGLGTLNNLDGELIVVDGRAFDVGADGVARAVANSELTPFAAVTYFTPDITIEAPNTLTAAQLKAMIDQSRGSDNLPYAVRISGTFTSVKTRSVAAQTPPYRPLTEVLKSQIEFPFENITGTIVGFWLPSYMNGANAGGYHLHFLTADGTRGGHLLDFTTSSVTVSLDETAQWLTQLPTKGEFISSGLSTEQYR